jgi:serine/threonine protein kinase
MYGDVRRVNDPKNPERKIAVKRSFRPDDQWVFIQEIEILVKLRHPCVIEIYGWSPGDSKTIEIQMQYAENGSLSRHLTRRQSGIVRSFGNPTRKAQLICDLVLGMRHVHSRRIIHRDLKPANILIDANWRGLIGDFGWSRSMSATGRPTPEAGTWLYAAPEQLRPGYRYDEKVDVFAFGLIAYEIIGDHPAFPAGRSTTMPTLPTASDTDAFGALMGTLLPRCWSVCPGDRPYFQEIFAAFEACRFAILPAADAKAISEAVFEVLRLEKGRR